MLDLKTIRENEAIIRKAIRDKQLGDVEGKLTEVLQLDEELRLLKTDLEAKQSERNSASKEIGEKKRKGEDASAIIARMGDVSAEVKKLEERQRSLEEQLHLLLLEMPNPAHESVPYGESEHDNVVAKEWGELPSFDFEAKPHWELELFKKYFDLEAGVLLTGAGFPVYRGQGAKLLRALIQFSLNALAEEGYTEIIPPLLINEATATGTAQLPDKEGQMYQVHDGFYLVPTAEPPVTNLHRDEILDTAVLPLKYCGHTPCFRREAGSYGKHVRGLNRVHQFDKVEMVQLVHPEESYNTLESMTAFAEGLLERLGLPYRRLLMCTGDMGFAQAKKYDLEVWSAGQERWLEVSSVSNFGTFQAQRMMTRFRDGGKQGKGKTELVHTLNGSAFGMVRVIAAILENYQEADGRVRVPEALQTLVGSAYLS